MALRLNDSAFEFARSLIADGEVVFDEHGDWREHQPTALQRNEFIDKHGMEQYAKWHLAVDDEESEDNKGRYTFPYGDFEKVHRCGLLSAESRAGQYKHHDIETAAAHLHGMIDAVKSTGAAQRASSRQ